MVKKYKAVDVRILDLLREYPNVSFSSKQVHDKVGGSNKRWTDYWLQKLTEQGHIYRKPGPGHSYLYSSTKTSAYFQKNPTKASEPTTPEIPRVKVTAANVRSLLKGWSEKRWNPKIYQSAKYLPLSLARLFELTHEVLYGGTVTKSELDKIYSNLEMFKKDLTSTLTTLNSIMETPELWDPKTFFGFLMEGAPPVDQLRDMAVKLKEHYNASKESE